MTDGSEKLYPGWEVGESKHHVLSYGELYHFMGRHNRASNIPREFVFVEILNVTYDSVVVIVGSRDGILL